MSGRRALISRSRLADWIGSALSPREDGAREGVHPTLGRRELAGEARIYARGGEHVGDQAERGNSHHDRGTPVDASQENALRRVDQLHGDDRDRIAGEDGAVGPVAVQESADVDAEPEPAREADQEQLAALREQPGDHERGGNPDDGGEDPVDRLLVGLAQRLAAPGLRRWSRRMNRSGAAARTARRVATIMAAQIRSANAQEESGNPAMVTGGRTL